MPEEIIGGKIVRLEATNVRKLSAVEVFPDKDNNLVVVGGNNEQGKSTVLDSIMFAIAGKNSIPTDVLKHGEKKGSITVELEDIIVTRVFGKGAKLEVKSKNGAKFSSPQKLLDSIAGKLTFDPLHFQRLGDTQEGRREQVTILKEIVGLDFSELEEEKAKLYEGKTEINRDIKKLENSLGQIMLHDNVPEKPIIISDIIKKLEDAKANNSEKTSLENTKVSVKTEIDKIDGELLALESKKKELNEDKDFLLEKKSLVEKKIKGFVEIDEKVIMDEIENVELVNDKVKCNQAFNKMTDEKADFELVAAGLTEEIKNLDTQKLESLKEAKMPIEKLSFSEDGVLYKDKQFHNCSSAEKLRISAAIAVAMNPKLRIMLIRDGSLLDDNSLNQIQKIATDTNTQIWLERVGEGEECSIIIEDGKVLKTKKTANKKENKKETDLLEEII